MDVLEVDVVLNDHRLGLRGESVDAVHLDRGDDVDVDVEVGVDVDSKSSGYISPPECHHQRNHSDPPVSMPVFLPSNCEGFVDAYFQTRQRP